MMAEFLETAGELLTDEGEICVKDGAAEY